MNVSLKKTVAGTMAALTLAFAVFAAAPASAGTRCGGVITTTAGARSPPPA